MTEYTDNQIRKALWKDHHEYLTGNPIDDDDMTMREYEDYTLDMNRQELIKEVETQTPCNTLEEFMELFFETND